MSGHFETAAEALARRARTPGISGAAIPEELPPLPSGALVVAPELSLDQAKRVWVEFLDLRDVILGDPNCVDDIEGARVMNRTGATRLGLAFGLSIRQVAMNEGRVQVGEADWDYRYIVTVEVSKGTRKVEGIGSCRLSEISASTHKGKPVPEGQREHFALTRAWTRAAKRAIADILGGTDADD